MPGLGEVTFGTRGEGFLDIHLNATTRWKDVPAPIWAYTLGGYQVLKKWLSYRESALLGRPLTSDEAQQFPTTSAASPASSPYMLSWTRITENQCSKARPHLPPATSHFGPTIGHLRASPPLH